VERLVTPQPRPVAGPAPSIVSLWVAERVTFDPLAMIEKDVMYLDHLRWREQRGLVPVKKSKFGVDLHVAVPELVRYRPGNANGSLAGRRQMYRGVRLKS